MSNFKAGKMRQEKWMQFKSTFVIILLDEQIQVSTHLALAVAL